MKRVKELVEKVKGSVNGYMKSLGEDPVGALKFFGATLVLVGAVGAGFNVYSKTMDSKEAYTELEEKYGDVEDMRNSLANQLASKKNELESVKSECEEYLSLNDQEKEIVDNKIAEVKQATADQLEAEKKAKEEEEARKKAEEEATKKAAEEEEARKKAEEEVAKKEAEAHKYETGLTWEDIAREGKVGTLGQFEGKIIQVINGTSYTQYRIAINGDYDQVMLVQVNRGVASETLLDDDYVYFKGKSCGTTTYTTVLGASVTIPAFSVDEIHR